MDIDVVIPWVDPTDKEWQASKNKFLEDLNNDKVDNSENRFRDWDNFKYVFRGIDKFMPWVHKIYLITCGQVPDWMNKEADDRIVIVNHSDYIPKEYLPTFSSHPIELNLHRIKELSEHFIYLNDDYFVINETSPEDFFIDGLPCDYALEDPITPDHKDIFNNILINNMVLLNSHYDRRTVLKEQKKKFYSMCDKKAFVTNMCFRPLKRNHFFGLHYSHLASNILKSTIEKVWTENREILEATSSHKFRNADDVNQFIFKNEQYVTGKFHPYNINRFGRAIQLDDTIEGAVEDVCRTITDSSYKMICINDCNIEDFDNTRTKINAALEKILPNPSVWER
ncbi:capsular polysaccharide phosphotransferase eps10H [Eshraghiella crossota CAG:259]|uniref:Capsular polysaccharide phosphotransferase eps10H n=1 Tax=Eshraghiella crossota CAG:259 TaxID=1263062 RepID=R5LAN3_9FIRM|nr:capsular polysaccharide phosphotransferase eps10H [Butyrivibrio crossotus CAG:259]